MYPLFVCRASDAVFRRSLRFAGKRKTAAHVGDGMRAKREYRDRGDVEVAVLDALVDRAEEGMTVFELRAAVDADIDTIEQALGELKADSLISVEEVGELRIHPDDRVVPDPEDLVEDDQGFFDAVRQKLGL